MTIKLNAVLPKDVNMRDMEQKIIDYMQQVNEQMAQDFEKTQSTWTHKAVFTKEVHVQIGQIISIVSTESDVYRWVSGGTKNHFISGKVGYKAGAFVPGSGTLMTKTVGKLIWQSGYNHKSAPGSLVSSPGGHFGPYDGFSRGHMVSGITPRMFDFELVNQVWRDKFLAGAAKVIQDIANSTGHK